MHFGPYSVELSNLEKIFFPDAGLTKGDLVSYYRDIADIIVPYMKDRPLTMHRFPDGLDGESWYQKNIGDYFPDWIETVTVEKDGGTVTHVLCNNAATLVYLANQAAITFHVWLSRADRQHAPDRMIFDLDPPGDDFEPVRDAAFVVKELLETLGLKTFVMTTGSSGCHVVCPLDRSRDFAKVRSFAQQAAQLLADRHPDHLTTETRKAKRGGRVYLDVARNAYAQTGVSPYSLRALPGAPVAVPLEWRELRDTKIGPRTYTITNIFRRLGHKDDPWKGLGRHARSLSGPVEALGQMQEQNST
ncbi:MAG: non-homologous end-joining DNA ligase [Armatimonadota bacterium]